MGCSDDYVYSGEWRTENYIVVTLLGIIAFFILLGTAMDTYEKDKRQNMGYQIVKAFSLKENLKFIFNVPAAGGSGRFDCLEGMRSLREKFSFFSKFRYSYRNRKLSMRNPELNSFLSMTWVILGHHFEYSYE